MPATQIDIRMQYTVEQEQQLMNTIFDALQQSFKLDVYDRNIRLQVHAPHRFQVFDYLSQPERFTHITIDCFVGRRVETKRKLYQQLVKNLVTFGIPADHILITLRESPLENWGIRGGQLASDVDFEFKIDV